MAKLLVIVGVSDNDERLTIISSSLEKAAEALGLQYTFFLNCQKSYFIGDLYLFHDPGKYNEVMDMMKDPEKELYFGSGVWRLDFTSFEVDCNLNLL